MEKVCGPQDAAPLIMLVSNAKDASEESAAIKAALDHAFTHHLWLYAFLRLAATSGARRSELLGLRRDDFDAELLYVAAMLHYRTARRVVVQPFVPMNIAPSAGSDRCKLPRSRGSLRIDRRQPAVAIFPSPIDHTEERLL